LLSGIAVFQIKKSKEQIKIYCKKFIFFKNIQSKVKYNILSRISQQNYTKKCYNARLLSRNKIMITLFHFLRSLRLNFLEDSQFNLLQILIIYRFIKKNINSFLSYYIAKINFYNYFHNNSHYSNYIYSPFKVTGTVVNSLSIYTSLSDCIQMVKIKIRSIFTLLNKNISFENYKKNLLIILFLKRNPRYYNEYLTDFVNNKLSGKNILSHCIKIDENSVAFSWMRLLSKYKKLTKVYNIINNIIHKKLNEIAPNVIILIGMKNTSKLLKKTGNPYQLSKLYSSTVQKLCKFLIQDFTLCKENLKNNLQTTKFIGSKKFSRALNKILRTLACKLLISARLDTFQIKADFSYSIISRGIIEAKIETIEREKNHLL